MPGMENPNWLYYCCHCFAALLLYYPAAAAAAVTAAILSPPESSNTSGYIIFVVVASPSCCSNSESLLISVTFNSVIYSCPCVKISIYKLTLIKLKDCPYDLFIVIAKHSWIKNYFLLTINGSSLSVEVSLMQGISCSCL